MGQAGPGPGGGPGRRAVEVATAVIVAVIVASGVVAVGVATRDDQPNTADAGSEDSPSEEPEAGAPETTPPDDTAEPEDEPTDGTDDPPDGEPTGQFRPEATKVELGVDQPDYTGRCPVTLEFQGRITTNTGPVRVDVEWRNADAAEVEGELVQFGGPGPGAEPVPQGADVTHTVDVADDATIQRTLVVIDPNEVASNTVEATVTCTPYAEITKGGDDFDAGAALCHTLQFDASITVPHDMTVTYEWLRSDGATDTTGPHTVEFNSGGTQTQSIPGQTWNLGDLEGQYGYRLHIIEPSDVTSDLVAYDVPGCSGPAT